MESKIYSKLVNIIKKKQTQRFREQTGGYQLGKDGQYVHSELRGTKFRYKINYSDIYNMVNKANVLYLCGGGLKVKVKLLSRVQLFATPWTIAHQAPPSMGFSRQECWSGLPFPSPGDLPHPGIEPRSPTLQADTLTSELGWWFSGQVMFDSWDLMDCSLPGSIVHGISQARPLE